MSRDALVVRTKWGLHVPAADLYLDARSRAPGPVFVSHAHSDHCSSAARIICTPETAALHRHIRGGKRQFTTLAYGEPFPLGAASVHLAPAGHTLGSAMAVVDTPAGRVAYTGDYKLRASAFSTGVHAPRCDALVMECTFGHPRYRFPPEHEVLERLYAFIDQALAEGTVPVVLAYAFGKTQEALYHLTSRGYHVGVAEPGAHLCQAHVDLGYTFPGPGKWAPYSGGATDAQVLLMTSRGRELLKGKATRYRFVHLTGWACGNRLLGRDLALPFSGHADFDELVRTARESGAAKVYTVHGSPQFAARLRSLGIEAEHLGPNASASPRAATAIPIASRRQPAPPRTGHSPQLALELS